MTTTHLRGPQRSMARPVVHGSVSALHVVATRYSSVTLERVSPRLSRMGVIATPMHGDCPGLVNIFPTVAVMSTT